MFLLLNFIAKKKKKKKYTIIYLECTIQHATNI